MQLSLKVHPTMMTDHDVAPTRRRLVITPEHTYALSNNQVAILVCVSAAGVRQQSAVVSSLLTQIARHATTADKSYVITACKRLTSLGLLAAVKAKRTPGTHGRTPAALMITPQGIAALKCTRDHYARLIAEIDALYPR